LGATKCFQSSLHEILEARGVELEYDIDLSILSS